MENDNASDWGYHIFQEWNDGLTAKYRRKAYASEFVRPPVKGDILRMEDNLIGEVSKVIHDSVDKDFIIIIKPYRQMTTLHWN